ncbi:phage antirepressor N-terminal domain-containing protein [Acinetobacter ursingii]|uniref:phage antirepressor N-terminal domain-containing protein n=1 Tax=Acinetobacter TaxID=469 RepID=UPI001FD1D4CC|nr:MULTISPECIES: phage antirepressor N-terminal domain-containing protein [Acinetobacter]MDH0008601.1 phage antirepressor N-terminal domain-containing protein [Acinetobacter ursingii]MDH0480775.1 phage antirepressor N-terminal domain-containing protein [Acinetobacter ursingii]MDH2120999.1 phage antirepressor N-terminal domain-containing protein [Acinetobacter ursingii]MDH2128377.1 phage antirepressor N-terminal domain-containing protein [Acinetobacter ursingii]
MNTIAVPFHHAELYLVEHNGQPYVPMRSIVQGIGLDWKSQFVKLKQKFETCVVEITMQINGDDQARSHTCLLLRKLPAWLYSIHANKVKPELRDTVIMYQNECDDVLWDYWTKGQAVNPRPKRTTKDKRTALHEAIALLMTKSKHLHFKDCYKIIHQRFEVDHLDEIPEEQLPDAVAYVHSLMTGGGADIYYENRVHNVSIHMLWVSGWWRCYRDAIQLLNPQMYAEITDHFKDGELSASLLLGTSKTESVFTRVKQDYPFLLNVRERVEVLSRK